MREGRETEERAWNFDGTDGTLLRCANVEYGTEEPNEGSELLRFIILRIRLRETDKVRVHATSQYRDELRMSNGLLP